MRVFIATDPYKLKSSVFPEIAGRTTSKGVNYLSEKTPLLYFNQSENVFTPEIKPSCNLILLLDVKYQESILKLTPILDSDFLLHHGIPENVNYSEFKNKVSGAHERHDTKYPPVFQIIFDDSITNKAEKIIKLLFKPVMLEDGGKIITEQQAQKALIQVTKALTLAFIKEQNKSDFIAELGLANSDLTTLLYYFEEHLQIRNEIKSVLSENNIQYKIEAFQRLSNLIEKSLIK